MTRSRQHLFPPDPPTSMTDRVAIVGNDWAAFSSLDALANHWERPAWPDGAQAYYWLLPLGMFPELRAQARTCQDLLSTVPDLDAVPEELLHLTLYRVGAANAITDEQLDSIGAAAKQRLKHAEPISLSIGPLAGSSGAIRYSVAPWSRLFEARDELIQATRSVLGDAANTGWRPHVSITYNARSRAAAPIIDRVRNLRTQPPVQVTVTDIELVKLTRTGRMYRWTTVHRLTLAEHPDN
ncbi:2'-5' RNA ligase family protein [Dactylosporangium matsuzakiense]|uniref:2'-5' RNA ligase superfamily protein n=1 Tax=Dactylosporangium matsuzakiense TaxID=53360 RepID=A0A9W6KU52_9ACTN|nr:2'-5' RNA ligase family protein [Dactylosporangium matsuzakiense]GLL07245.1 hypothetical protein GCM10017581_089970 [Dactylosporangium matsuzakiense]